MRQQDVVKSCEIKHPITAKMWEVLDKNKEEEKKYAEKV